MDGAKEVAKSIDTWQKDRQFECDENELGTSPLVVDVIGGAGGLPFGSGCDRWGRVGGWVGWVFFGVGGFDRRG